MSSVGGMSQTTGPIYVFTTKLANQAADAVSKGLFKNLSDFAQAQPVTKQALDSDPNKPPWINEFAQQQLTHQQYIQDSPSNIAHSNLRMLSSREEKLAKLAEIKSLVTHKNQQDQLPPNQQQPNNIKLEDSPSLSLNQSPKSSPSPSSLTPTSLGLSGGQILPRPPSIHSIQSTSSTSPSRKRVKLTPYNSQDQSSSCINTANNQPGGCKPLGMMDNGHSPCEQEPQLMPVPSPQQIQYLDTLCAQEITIQRQQNMNSRDSDPSLSDSGSDFNNNPMGCNPQYAMGPGPRFMRPEQPQHFGGPQWNGHRMPGPPPRQIDPNQPHPHHMQQMNCRPYVQPRMDNFTNNSMRMPVDINTHQYNPPPPMSDSMQPQFNHDMVPPASYNGPGMPPNDPSSVNIPVSGESVSSPLQSLQRMISPYDSGANKMPEPPMNVNMPYNQGPPPRQINTSHPSSMSLNNLNMPPHSYSHQTPPSSHPGPMPPHQPPPHQGPMPIHPSHQIPPHQQGPPPPQPPQQTHQPHQPPPPPPHQSHSTHPQPPNTPKQTVHYRPQHPQENSVNSYGPGNGMRIPCANPGGPRGMPPDYPVNHQYNNNPIPCNPQYPMGPGPRFMRPEPPQHFSSPNYGHRLPGPRQMDPNQPPPPHLQPINPQMNCRPYVHPRMDNFANNSMRMPPVDMNTHQYNLPPMNDAMQPQFNARTPWTGQDNYVYASNKFVS